MNKSFTISVFSEHRAGILNRVSIMFTRRKMNILSITVSESELPDIYRFTIVVEDIEENVAKLVKQIERQVEVHKAFYHTDENTIYQEIALYKIPTSVLTHGGKAEKLVRAHHARVLAVLPEFTVVEKTGHKEETQALFEELKPYGILEFVRSGRIAITKPMKELRDYLSELEIASQVK